MKSVEHGSRKEVQRWVLIKFLLVSSVPTPFIAHLRPISVSSGEHRGEEELSQKPKVKAINTLLWILSGETPIN